MVFLVYENYASLLNLSLSELRPLVGLGSLCKEALSSEMIIKVKITSYCHPNRQKFKTESESFSKCVPFFFKNVLLSLKARNYLQQHAFISKSVPLTDAFSLTGCYGGCSRACRSSVSWKRRRRIHRAEKSSRGYDIFEHTS